MDVFLLGLLAPSGLRVGCLSEDVELLDRGLSGWGCSQEAG
jgi:hypothetical protein